jgi:hypothetical protein
MIKYLSFNFHQHIKFRSQIVRVEAITNLRISNGALEAGGRIGARYGIFFRA